MFVKETNKKSQLLKGEKQGTELIKRREPWNAGYTKKRNMNAGLRRGTWNAGYKGEKHGTQSIYVKERNMECRE